MAFTVTSPDPELIKTVGIATNLEAQFVVMASGTAVVTAKFLRVVHGAIGMVQGATGVGETVICTATSANTCTLETIAEGGTATGTSVVMVLMWGQARR